jgi:hypothetical protein
MDFSDEQDISPRLVTKSIANPTGVAYLLLETVFLVEEYVIKTMLMSKSII